MPAGERARHELFTRVEEVLGPVPAETLMGYLPPVGWADVVTKHDLREFEERFTTRIDSVETRLDERIDAVEAHLGGRIDAVEARLGGRIDAVEAHLGARIDAVEARMETLEHRLTSRMDQRFEAHARAMALQTWAILGALLVALVGAVVTTAVL